MKKIMILALTFTTSVFSGTLENRRTGETLNFELNTGNIVSVSNRVSFIKRLNFKNVSPKRSYIEFLAGNEYVDDSIYEDIDLNLKYGYYNRSYAPDVILTVVIPLYNVPRVLGTVYDLAVLPFKVTAKLFQKMKYNKDFNKLAKAINTNKTVKVSNKRFRRVERLLNIH